MTELRLVLGDRANAAHHAGEITVITKTRAAAGRADPYEQYQQLTDTNGSER